MKAIIAWLTANIGTIIICAILIAIIALLIYSMIRDKKKGKSFCGCGCSSCALSGSCHNTAPKEKKSNK